MRDLFSFADDEKPRGRGIRGVTDSVSVVSIRFSVLSAEVPRKREGLTYSGMKPMTALQPTLEVNPESRRLAHFLTDTRIIASCSGMPRLL